MVHPDEHDAVPVGLDHRLQAASLVRDCQEQLGVGHSRGDLPADSYLQTPVLGRKHPWLMSEQAQRTK